jgi:ornithine carbamoyltransferase
MSATGKKSHFMHPLPAKRGIEVTDSVMDSNAQIIFDEAENRMHVQNAIMLKIAGK